MATKIDYYEILEVERTATKDEISTAYRKQAMKYHPDRNPGDDQAVEKFKMAAEAFEVLNNDDKRRLYDQYGHAGLERGGGSPHFHDVGDIFDAFGDIFGGGIFGDLFGGRRSRGPQRGSDIRCNVEIDLFEAAHGVNRTIEFTRHEVCQTCNGSGCKPGTEPETCRYCGGMGRISQSTGIFSIQTPCPQCRGQGSIIQTPCETCRGAGLVGKRVKREVRIPHGVDTGTRLRLQGEGERSPTGGPSGDCYIFITVKEHPIFHREGEHLIIQVPIGYAQAALGAEIEVPTLEGPHKLKIPAGTQNGAIIKLRNLGMPIPHRSLRGDLIVQVYIEVPKKLSPEHERILRELAEVEHETVSPERKSFFEKIKDYFSSKHWMNHNQQQNSQSDK